MKPYLERCRVFRVAKFSENGWYSFDLGKSRTRRVSLYLALDDHFTPYRLDDINFLTAAPLELERRVHVSAHLLRPWHITAFQSGKEGHEPTSAACCTNAPNPIQYLDSEAFEFAWIEKHLRFLPGSPCNGW